MVPWQTIQSLTLLLGPFLLPKALTLYRTLHNQPPSRLQSLPTKTSWSLLLLLLSALLALTSTLPLFSPANIFTLTSSSLQTPSSVLLARLSALRPLTPTDELLRKVLDERGLEARLLYARFGPEILVEGSQYLAKPGDLEAARSMLVFALPALLAPHFFHLQVLGVATSSRSGTGTGTGAWRTMATVAGVGLAVAEIWVVANYDDGRNAGATRLGGVEFLFWKMRVWRGVGIAGVDGLLGWGMWVQGTGRGFLTTTASTGERLGQVGRVVEEVVGKVRGVGIVRNGILRDGGLRRRVDGYWVKEGEVMRDVFEEPEVLEAQRRALRRVDVGRVGREAEAFLDATLGGFQAARDGVPERLQ